MFLVNSNFYCLLDKHQFNWLAKLIHGNSVLSADEDVDQAMVVLGRLPSRKLLWAFDIHGLILTYEGDFYISFLLIQIPIYSGVTK